MKHNSEVIEEYNTPTELDKDATSEDIDLELNLADDADALASVEVQVEKIAERQRQITAQVQIPQPVEKVWQVLTDYEALVDFIPNLAKSCLLEHPTGGIRLEQVGAQRFLRLNFRARVVLDLEEYFPKEISFQMVEGDFKDFTGSWQLEPNFFAGNKGTILRYIVRVWPKLSMPVGIIERHLSQGMRLNLSAIRRRVESRVE